MKIQEASSTITPVTAPAVHETHHKIDDAADFNRRGLFIGGCPKSGTTLLLSLLDSHPSLAVFPSETHYFEHRNEYRSLNGIQAKLLRLLEQCDTSSLCGEKLANEHFIQIAESYVGKGRMDDSLLLSETIRAFITAAGRDWRNCERWVEKTPNNVPNADELFRLFPDAKLLQIVRDPRAVFASRQKHLTNRLGKHAKAHRLVREWNECSRQIIRLRNRPDKYLVVRYEDLIQNTPVILEEICQFIGIKFYSSLLEPTFGGTEWHGNSAFITELNGIDSQLVNHWKSELTEEEIWWIELHCCEGMKIAGYPLLNDATFSFKRWAKPLPHESLRGYLRARKSSLFQLTGLMKECQYDLTPNPVK